MRVIAKSYVTTERFLKDFLVRANDMSKRVPIAEREWFDACISRMLKKFSFKGDNEEETR